MRTWSLCLSAVFVLAACGRSSFTVPYDLGVGDKATHRVKIAIEVSAASDPSLMGKPAEERTVHIEATTESEVTAVNGDEYEWRIGILEGRVFGGPVAAIEPAMSQALPGAFASVRLQQGQPLGEFEVNGSAGDPAFVQTFARSVILFTAAACARALPKHSIKIGDSFEETMPFRGQGLGANVHLDRVDRVHGRECLVIQAGVANASVTTVKPMEFWVFADNGRTHKIVGKLETDASGVKLPMEIEIVLQ